MKRHRGAAHLVVTELLVRTTLTHFREPWRNQDGDDFARLENGDVPHRSGDCDVLDTHELRLQLRLAVFKKHRDDFLQISVQLLKRLALRVRASESRDKPDEERSEEHTSELQSLMRLSYAVFCLKKKTNHHTH